MRGKRKPKDIIDYNAFARESNRDGLLRAAIETINRQHRMIKALQGASTLLFIFLVINSIMDLGAH